MAREEVIKVYVTPRRKERAAQLAAREGVSLSTYIDQLLIMADPDTRLIVKQRTIKKARLAEQAV